MKIKNFERLGLIALIVVVSWRLPDLANALENQDAREDLVRLQQELRKDKLPPMAGAFGKVAKVMAPSVVHVSVATQGLPGESNPRPTTGSGVIFAAEGYLLTNHHVIESGGEITVTLSDDRKLSAKRVGSDAATDLAVLKLEDGNYFAAELGDSDAMAVGDFVLACGSPFGLSRTVTAGIVSAKGRNDIGVANYENFIQTDAAINPGNSGGPLCNLRGQVIGINAAIASRTGGYAGIGFAIPINMAKVVAQKLIKAGHVDRGYLGVRIANIDKSEATKKLLSGMAGAVRIAEVVKGSPADSAGVHKDDLIVTIGGKAMKDANTLRNFVAFLEAGKTVEIEVLRDKKLLALTVKLALRK